MNKFSIDFDIKVKDFVFYNEFLIKGKNQVSSGWQKVKFNHFANWDVSKSLINENERSVKFHFKLIMEPDFGEMIIEGNCTIESPEQHKISFLLQNAPKPFNIVIEKFIVKNSYVRCEQFAKEQKIPFPPAQFILRKFGIR